MPPELTAERAAAEPVAAEPAAAESAVGGPSDSLVAAQSEGASPHPALSTHAPMSNRRGNRRSSLPLV